MLISPPFLVGEDDASILQSGLNPVPTRDSTTQAPEGNFPVSQNLMWHTGIHLEAPQKEDGGYAPVRAIADGKVIFINPPRPKVDDVCHSQAYNPFGDSATWTDNGMIIIEHETEIGAEGNTPTKFKYYSSYLHLSKVQLGVAKDSQVYRKDVIGETGEIFGHAGEMEMSIACNADELKKLIGRPAIWQDSKQEPASDGRTDSVFGNLYIYLPANTPVSTTAPNSHLRAVSGNTLGTAQWVEINYSLGQGTLTTYAVDGTKGNITNEADFEYNLYEEANTRHRSVIAGDPAIVSSPSGWYELLRFGRNLGRSTTDKDALPANPAHWRKIKTVGGQDVWVDLNAEGSRKFSEADFLPVMGWNCYDDDSQPADQRCDSAKLKDLLADPADPDSKNDNTKLAARLGLPEVFPKLARTICKFPNEWDKDTIVTRYRCLHEEAAAETGGTVEGWQAFEDHLKIMAFDTLPEEFKQADWHFHPAEFIRTMKKCGWLSPEELAQCLPRRSLSAANLTWNTAISRSKQHSTILNKYFLKYLGESKVRLIHSLAQIYIETGLLGMMNEGGEGNGHPYTAFFGRGYMQLTWAGNYKDYGDYKRLPNNTGAYSDPRITATSLHPKANGGAQITWSPRYDPKIVSTPAHLGESSGFYWVTKHFKGKININRVCDLPFTHTTVGFICWLINGGGNGYADRHQFAKYLKNFLLDAPLLEGTASFSYPPLTPMVNLGTVQNPNFVPLLCSHYPPVEVPFSSNGTVYYEKQKSL